MNEGAAAWQELLKKELKTDDLGRWLQRPLLEGGSWSLLAQNTLDWAAPNASAAALGYVFPREEDFSPVKVQELLALGVWDFTLDPFILGWDAAQLKKAFATVFPSEARLWVMLPTGVKAPAPWREILHGTPVWAQGAHGAHESAWLLDGIINWAQTSQPNPIGVAMSFDGEFFKSIARMRALKATVQSALTTLGKAELFSSLTWVGRVSWREFSLFDCASNLLRNTNALAAAYVAGAEVVLPLPHDLLLENTPEERARAERLTLTTQLVLQAEVGLGEVQDAASGSYALEELARTMGQDSWECMQKWRGGGESTVWDEVRSHWEELQFQMRHRTRRQAGVNDVPDATERVRPRERFLRRDHVRLGRVFEEQRLRMQNLKRKPRVCVPVVGDYAALGARLGFTKNAFELLGLEVIEPGRGLKVTEAEKWIKEQACEICAVVASDEEVSIVTSWHVEGRAFVATPKNLPGWDSLHAKMDMAQFLEALTAWWETRL